MQEFTIFDMVILGITLVLGLKGLFRGLIKEVFGIVGIIGAIFIASRISGDIGNIIAPILAIQSESTTKLIGFVVSLIGFWVIVYLLGVIVSKIFSASGLGLVDRIFGFLFGAAKVFLIFSVIAYALYQVESFKKAIDKKTKSSMVMPHLLSVGSYIIKLDTSVISDSIEKTVDTVVDKTKEVTKDVDGKALTEEIKENIEETKKDLTQGVEETVKEVKESLEEEVTQTVKEKLKSIANEN